jgi:hypothetical protein
VGKGDEVMKSDSPAPTDSKDQSGSVEAKSSFDWKALAQDTTYHDVALVQKNQTRIPIGKPSKEKFCRAHPGEEFELDLALLEIKDSNDLRGIYLPAPNSPPELENFLKSQLGVVRMKKLLLGTYLDGSNFIWNLNLDTGGSTNAWNQTAMDAAKLGKEQWVRVVASMENGFYEIFTSETALTDPAWPESTFSEILDKAFNGRIIESMDHPVVSFLLGR